MGSFVRILLDYTTIGPRPQGIVGLSLQRLEIHEIRVVDYDRFGGSLAQIAFLGMIGDHVQDLGRKTVFVCKRLTRERVPEEIAEPALADFPSLLRVLKQFADIMQYGAGDQQIHIYSYGPAVLALEGLGYPYCRPGDCARVMNKIDLDAGNQ